MTWLEPHADTGQRLRFARFLGEDWSAPYTVARGVVADESEAPSLAAVDTDAGRATLLVRAGGLVAQSTDGGRIWRRVRTPVLGSAALVGGFEEAYAFWREPDGRGSVALWGAAAFVRGRVLDPRVDERGAPSAAWTADGPVVVYRDAGSDDLHDITIVGRDGERWSEPRVVGADGWRSSEGPLSGPAVAARDRQVAVAWYTNAESRPEVLISFSSDAGMTFAEPVEVDGPLGSRAPSGAVSVAIDEDAHAVVFWVTSNRAGENELILSRIAADGRRGEEMLLASMRSGQLRGDPRMTAWGNRVAVAWEEGGARAGVRAVAVPMNAIPAPTVPAAAPESNPRARIGELVPALEATSLDGNEVSLATLAGRPVLLNLWATWCLPCREELPELVKLHERYGPEGLAVVGVSVDRASAAEKVRDFVVETQIPFAIWLDPQEHFSRAFGVRGVPATFVIDRSRHLLFGSDRPLTAEEPELLQALARALE